MRSALHSNQKRTDVDPLQIAAILSPRATQSLPAFSQFNAASPPKWPTGCDVHLDLHGLLDIGRLLRPHLASIISAQHSGITSPHLVQTLG